MSLLAIVLPVFGLIAIGFVAARTGLIKDHVGDGLSDFVFSVAVPCLLFKTLATADVPEASPWTFWLAYFTAIIPVWVLAHLIVTRLFGRDKQTGTVAGFSSAQANTVLIGIPLILTTFGEAGRVPIFLLIAIHLPIMMTAATLAIELGGRREDGDLGGMIRSLVKAIVTHPIIIAIVLGVGWRFTGFTIPAIPFQIIELLGSTAVPCALFSAGMALMRYGLAGDLRITLLVSGLKLMVQPGLVFALGLWLGLPPVWLGGAVLFAACPSGINAYLLANRYGTGVRIASSSIALSTALAVISVTFWLWVLSTFSPAPIL